MEHYTKGEVREVEDCLPFPLEDSLQMRVTAGSKIRNVMTFALKKMATNDVRQLAWNGAGPTVTKAITCAEIMKRKVKGLHQITKIRYKRLEEHWVPTVEGLEPLKVNRNIPAISILLSKDPLDSSEAGYQPPGSFETFWQNTMTSGSGVRRRPRVTHSSGGQEGGRGGRGEGLRGGGFPRSGRGRQQRGPGKGQRKGGRGGNSTPAETPGEKT